MAGMQDVETAIGEADPLALLAPFRELRIQFVARGHDLFLGGEERMRQDLAAQFRRRHHRGALLADRDRGGGVRHPQGRFPIGAGGQRHRQRRGDGVAGAGDVAHLDRKSRHMDGIALARHQGHAVLALRHQHRLAIGQLHDLLGAVGDAPVGIEAAAGGFGEFLAIGL